jgi:hypothetical protein
MALGTRLGITWVLIRCDNVPAGVYPSAADAVFPVIVDL